MPAVATDGLRNLFADLLRSDIISSEDSSPFYIGFGKSDLYDSNDTTTTPDRSRRGEMLARTNLQSVKRVTEKSLVVPRYNWTSGTLYSGWDDKASGYPSNPYYVITENNEVYVCLRQGLDDNGVQVASTIIPSYNAAGVSLDKAFQTADGYVWKFLYKVGATSAANFLSASFVPVETVLWDSFGDSSNLSPDQLDQLTVQQTAVQGQIVGVEVVDGGTGFVSSPTVSFLGNGTGASATATISNGSIVKVDMVNESAGLGSGYDFASILISGGAGVNAELRPILGPPEGFGKDIPRDLKSSSVMLNTVTAGAENNDFIVANDFRQITVFKDLKDPSGNNFTDVTGTALSALVLTDSGDASTLTIDNIVIGDSTASQAFINKIDGNKIYYHQNEITGFGTFSSSEPVSENNGNGQGLISSIIDGEIDRHSGSLLYLENRSRIIRSTQQQEDIKVVITL